MHENTFREEPVAEYEQAFTSSSTALASASLRGEDLLAGLLPGQRRTGWCASEEPIQLPRRIAPKSAMRSTQTLPASFASRWKSARDHDRRSEPPSC